MKPGAQNRGASAGLSSPHPRPLPQGEREPTPAVIPVLPCDSRPSLSFPRNLSPTFVIGDREPKNDAVHVHGVSSVIPPSAAILPFSVILPPSVILSEAKNLASRLPGHDAGGMGPRIEGGHFFPSPRPSPARGEGVLGDCARGFYPVGVAVVGGTSGSRDPSSRHSSGGRGRKCFNRDSRRRFCR